MFSAYRLNLIKEILEEKKYVDVSYLSTVLSVSDVTIRRDLTKLEESGFLVRSFGGAALAGTGESIGRIEPTVDQPDAESAEMSLIGKIAAAQIKPGDVTFIGNGEEGRYIARSLPKDLTATVVTNDLTVARQFQDHARINIMLTGGVYYPAHDATFGDFTIQDLQGVCLSNGFVTVDGVSLDKGFSIASFEQGGLLKYLRANVPELTVVVRADKFGRNSSFVISDPTGFSSLITSFSIPEDYKAFCFSHNIKLFTALP